VRAAAGSRARSLPPVPGDQFDAALNEIGWILRSDSPLAVGMWAGDDTESYPPANSFHPAPPPQLPVRRPAPVDAEPTRAR